MRLPLGLNFVAIDAKTVRGKNGSVCVLGMVRIEDDKVVAQSHFLVHHDASYDASEAPTVMPVGITPEDVQNRLQWSDARVKIASFVQDDYVVFHDSAATSKILIEATRAARIRRPDISDFCSLKLSQEAFPSLKNYDLLNVARGLKIGEFHYHPVVQDAWASAMVCVSIANRIGASSILHLMKAYGIEEGRIGGGREHFDPEFVPAFDAALDESFDMRVPEMPQLTEAELAEINSRRELRRAAGALVTTDGSLERDSEELSIAGPIVPVSVFEEESDDDGITEFERQILLANLREEAPVVRSLSDEPVREVAYAAPPGTPVPVVASPEQAQKPKFQSKIQHGYSYTPEEPRPTVARQQSPAPRAATPSSHHYAEPRELLVPLWWWQLDYLLLVIAVSFNIMSSTLSLPFFGAWLLGQIGIVIVYFIRKSRLRE